MTVMTCAEELESSIKEAADAGVPQHELSEAQEKMRQHRRRLAVRNAVFAQQRARNRLADAWDALDKSVEPNERMTFVEQAVKEGEEACLLCAKAAQKMEESRLREAIEVLCKKWVRLVQTKIEEAMRGQNVSALRLALSEGQVVKDSMVKGFGSSESKGPSRDCKDEGGVELPSTPPKLPAGEEPSRFDVEAFDGLLQQGRSALDAEERRSSAEARLSEALDSTSAKCVKSSGKLRELLQESKQCLVDSNLIASAEKRLAAMEGEAAAKWMLITASLRARAGTLASCVSGPEDMKFAIKSAKSMGLSKVQLESALETYDKLEKLQVIFYVLSDALKETDVTQIREVLRRVSATGLVAHQSPLLTVYLTRLRHHLERLEKQQQASERVKEAMSTDRHSIILDELPTRIEEAKRSGVRDSSLEGAEEKLRISRAQVRLEAALACPSELKDAYREALAAGVDQELLSEAAEVLEAEELRSRIKEFAASLQLVSLERSLKLWAEKGYNGADIAELEAQLPELRRQLSQCQEELDMAMKPIGFMDVPDDGMKLQQNALEVLDQVALVLEKHPRLPIVVEVCASPSQSEEEKFSQATVVKKELLLRCSNEIRTSSGTKSGPLNVRIRVASESKSPVKVARERDERDPSSRKGEVLMPKAPKSPPKPRKGGERIGK